METERKCGHLLKLHIGCGTRRLPGYVNIDHRPEVEPDKVMDAMHLVYEFGEDSADEVYACHLLEHFKRPSSFLAECHQVLRYHGVLRLSVPDLDEIFGAYNAGVHLSRLSGLIWGGHNFEGDVHHHGWDFEELAQLLRMHCFYDVQRWWPRHTFPAGYHDISYAKVYTSETEEYAVSLNVKAKKI